jgi:hypothetical protein
MTDNLGLARFDEARIFVASISDPVTQALAKSFLVAVYWKASSEKSELCSDLDCLFLIKAIMPIIEDHNSLISIINGSYKDPFDEI